ncbi:hypothetical protein ABZP36_003270 [Zizania latifolia]
MWRRSWSVGLKRRSAAGIPAFQATIAEGAPEVSISALLKYEVNGNASLQEVWWVNQNIEVHPGIVVKDESGNIECT